MVTKLRGGHCCGFLQDLALMLAVLFIVLIFMPFIPGAENFFGLVLLIFPFVFIVAFV
ncbi:hypothetical protein [Thermococcus piezophilus]|uniref:hypothetical protein n=1 Tax=Thermococcus piezophilus TaxID=1712654 RepID=UPI000A4050FD|nr:hypothetical protein [Thermococcus piezophilus]